MKTNRQGFNPQQLVARGVCASLEEADAVLCDCDDARPGPTVLGVSWMQGFGFTVQVTGSKLNFPAACAVGVGRPATSPSGVATARTAEAGSGVVNTSRRSPELLPESASVLCPWCAIERARSGQGSAPRTGFVSVVRCDRHSAEPPAAFLASPQSPQSTGVRDATLHAPAPVLPLRGAAGAEPFHPTLNPNAGVVPAFPKGRWL